MVLHTHNTFVQELDPWSEDIVKEMDLRSNTGKQTISLMRSKEPREDRVNNNGNNRIIPGKTSDQRIYGVRH